MAAINFPNSPSPGDTYTAGNVLFEWDGTTWKGKTTVVGYVGSAGATGQLTGYNTTIGDNVNTAFTITHALNKEFTVVTARETTSGYWVYPDVQYLSSTSVSLSFVYPPTTSQYTVYVSGF